MKSNRKVYNYKRVMVNFNLDKDEDAMMYKYISDKHNDSQAIKELIKLAMKGKKR